MNDLRLCTWNVRALRDDRAAVVRTLRRLAPDVVCLQETPWSPRWRTRLAALARESGLLFVTGARASTALLAAMRVDVREAWMVPLSATPRLERRSIAVARLRLPTSACLGVAAVHLGLDAAERARHVPEVEAALASTGAPYAVVAGDVNERPGEPGWAALCRSRVDCGGDDERSTFHGRSSRRIDGIFADPAAELLGYDVLDDADARAGSDHLPVIGVLRLPEAAALPS